MHLFEPIAYQFERFTEAFFERALQLFVYGGAHLVDLLRIVLLQLLQTKIDDRTNTLQRGRQFFTLTLSRRRVFLAATRHFLEHDSLSALVRALQHFDFS